MAATLTFPPSLRTPWASDYWGPRATSVEAGHSHVTVGANCPTWKVGCTLTHFLGHDTAGTGDALTQDA